MSNIVIKGKEIAPFYIEKDNLCYSVYQEKINEKTKEPYGKLLSNFTNFDFCVKEVAQLLMLHRNDGKTVTLGQYVKDFRKVIDEITNIFK